MSFIKNRKILTILIIVVGIFMIDGFLIHFTGYNGSQWVANGLAWLFNGR